MKKRQSEKTSGLSGSRVAELLASERAKTGLSQAELAILIGSSESMLSKIENNKAPLSLGMLDRIANVLNRDMPEVVIMRFLQLKYPRLMDTEVGEALMQIKRDLASG